MSESDKTEQVQAFFARDKFARLAGIELEAVEEGYARASLQVSEVHRNALGITQGGVLFTLADFAFAAASASRGTAAVALHADISFHRPTTEGRLTAQAREISRSRKTACYEVIIADRDSQRVATFQGIGYLKEAKLSDL